MSRLLKQAEQDKERKRLQKAGDADRDPADLDVGGAPAWEAPEDASQSASDSASENEGGKASGSASENDGGSASGKDSGSAGGSAGGDAGGKGGVNAGGNVKDSAAGREESGGRIRAPRRVGRPRGPDRVKLSVRITQDLDDQLSRAVDQTKMSPQYIVEEALAKHFRSLGLKPRA